VFIRPKSLDAKVSGPDFCICNYAELLIKYIAVCRPTMEKELWGTKLH
jgi:hypothetical protein